LQNAVVKKERWTAGRRNSNWGRQKVDMITFVCLSVVYVRLFWFVIG